MSIQWRAESGEYNTVVGVLRRGSRAEDSLGVLEVTGGAELLLTATELRELALVATRLAEQIEADR